MRVSQQARRGKALPAPGRPRVVIIGGGFGGISAARALADAAVDVTVIDRTNHHVFQPLLYQVASAVLPSSDVVAPIRRLLREQKNARVLLGAVVAIDVDDRVVTIEPVQGETSDDECQIPYDFLIVSAGLENDYFEHPEWASLAPGLKSIADAQEIRQRFLLSFEEAERTPDLELHSEFLTFVVIGGGATGVELAGILPAAREAMARDFRHVRLEDSRVILLEGSPRVLPTFAPELSIKAARDLRKLGVDVRTNAIVTRIEPDAVWIGDERIATRNVFWAAGMRGSPLGAQLGAPLNARGQVLVESDLSVPGRPEIYVVGDLAALRWDSARWIPQLAPFANQGGRSAAENILRSLDHEPHIKFKYFDKGMLATIGRHKAVGEFRGIRFSGYVAWWAWLLIHILYLVGFRNKLHVMVEWLWGYFTSEHGSRLISAPEEPVGAIDSPGERYRGVQRIGHEPEHVNANRHPAQLTGHERRTIRAARASGVLDEVAEELEDGVIEEPLGLQLVARGNDSALKRGS